MEQDVAILAVFGVFCCDRDHVLCGHSLFHYRVPPFNKSIWEIGILCTLVFGEQNNLVVIIIKLLQV